MSLPLPLSPVFPLYILGFDQSQFRNNDNSNDNIYQGSDVDALTIKIINGSSEKWQSFIEWLDN